MRKLETPTFSAAGDEATTPKARPPCFSHLQLETRFLFSFIWVPLPKARGAHVESPPPEEILRIAEAEQTRKREIEGDFFENVSARYISARGSFVVQEQSPANMSWTLELISAAQRDRSYFLKKKIKVDSLEASY